MRIPAVQLRAGRDSSEISEVGTVRIGDGHADQGINTGCRIGNDVGNQQRVTGGSLNDRLGSAGSAEGSRDRRRHT